MIYVFSKVLLPAGAVLNFFIRFQPSLQSAVFGDLLTFANIPAPLPSKYVMGFLK